MILPAILRYATAPTGDASAKKATCQAVLLSFVCGYAYEIAYFSRLGIYIPDGTGISHYALSGGGTFLWMITVLVVFVGLGYIVAGDRANVRRDSDVKELEAATIKAGQAVAFRAMRVGVGFAFCVLLLASLDISWLPAGRAGHLAAYVSFVSIFPLMITEEVRLRPIAHVVLAIALAMSLAAAGMDAANYTRGKEGVVRDDIFIVTRTGAEISAEPNNILKGLKKQISEIASLF